MGRAIAATTQVAFVPEVTDGTTPANPAFQLLRVTGESLEVQRKLVFSGELNAARGPKNYAIAGESGAGGFDFEFIDGAFEDLLESALRGAWATDVLVNGNTPKSFTMETKFETGATDTYKRLQGAQVGTFSLNARAQEIVTGRFDVMSRISAFAVTGVAGATYTAGNTEPIFVGTSVGSIASSGITYDAVHTLSLNLNNNMRGRPVLGSRVPLELAPGDLEITGTIGIYLSDTDYDVLDYFQTGLSTSLTFQLGTVAGKITRFELPNIVLEDPKPNAESKDGDLLLNLNFRALQASSLSNGMIRVTRNI